MFSHVMLGANDLDASRKFYDATLTVLGYNPGFKDPNAHRWFWASPTGNFAITKPIDGDPACRGNGSTVGFTCDSAEKVHAWHAAGVAAGGEPIEDAPGIRSDDQGNSMVLAYLRDPTGNKLCALHFLATSA